MMKSNSTTVQSVLFDKNVWKLRSAKKWLKENNFIAPKVDETANFFRFRQIEPDEFKSKSYRTILFGDKEDGIKAVIGELKNKKNPMENPMKVDGKTLVATLKELRKEASKVKTFDAKCSRVQKACQSINDALADIKEVRVHADLFTQQYPDGDSAKVCLIHTLMGEIAVIKPKGRKTQVHYMTDLSIGDSSPQIEFNGKIYCALAMKDLAKATYFIDNPHCMNNPESAMVDLEPPQILVDNPHCMNNPESALFDLEPPQILVDNPRNPHCYGMIYHNPPKKMADLKSFYGNAKLGNIFAGSSVIVVTKDGLKRINSNGKLTHVSAPVAYYVDLAGDAFLVADAKELEQARKLTKSAVKGIYDSALKYLKGAKGVSDIEEPTTTTAQEEAEGTADDSDVSKKDSRKVSAADVIDIFQIAVEEAKKKDNLKFDDVKVSEMIEFMMANDQKDDLKAIRTHVGSRSTKGIVKKMIEYLEAILDLNKAEREKAVKAEQEKRAKEEAKKKKAEEAKRRKEAAAKKKAEEAKKKKEEAQRKKEAAEKKKEAEKKKKSSGKKDAVILINQAIDEIQGEYPKSFLDNYVARLTPYMMELEGLNIEIEGLNVFEDMEDTEDLEMGLEAFFDAVSAEADNKAKFKLSMSNPYSRNLGTNRSYVYPMSVKDHNHQEHIFDMFSDEPIPNPTHRHHHVDGLGDWKDVLEESYDRVMKSKSLPKSFFDLYTRVEYAAAPHLRGADKANFNHHHIELLNMLGDISTADEGNIDRFEIQDMLSSNVFQEHLSAIDYYLRKGKRNPLQKKNNPLKDYQKPQQEIDGVKIDKDIYDYFARIYKYKAKLSLIKLLQKRLKKKPNDKKLKKKLKLVTVSMKNQGKAVIRAQLELIPALESKFKSYLKEGGVYPFATANPRHLREYMY